MVRPGEPGPSRRWLWIGLAACAVLVVAWLVLRPEPRGTEPRPEPVAGAPPPEPAAAPEVPSEALPEAVARYLAANVYPPSSGKLSADHEALLEPNRRYERFRGVRETRGDPGGPVTYRLTADRYDLTGNEETWASLEVRRGDGPLPLEGVEAELFREGRGGREGDPVPVLFGPDDLRWRARLPLDAVADHHGSLLLETRFEIAPGRHHTDAIRFFHTPADLVPARFTGSFHDYVRDGNLLVEVGLDVHRPGFYRIDANFFDADGQPAAYAAFKGELTEGATTVPLSVFGKVLRDAGARLPYTLDQLRGYRFIDGGYPDHETIPEAALRWTTGRYALAEFGDEAWESPDKQRMVELLMADAEAGISLDVPDLAEAPDAGAAPAAAPSPGAPEAPGD